MVTPFDAKDTYEKLLDLSDPWGEPYKEYWKHTPFKVMVKHNGTPSSDPDEAFWMHVFLDGEIAYKSILRFEIPSS